MWATILVLSFSNLPLWLLEHLSVLVLISLLSSLIVAMQNFSNANLRLRLKREKLKEDFGGSLSAMKENSNSFKEKDSSPVITMRRTAALMLIGICSVVLLAAYVSKQRGYCSATGDISFSDGMTVATDFRGKTEGDIINKFGVRQHICVSPTVSVDWVPGVYIKKAYYEYRNSCMDFSSKDAWFETDRDDQGHYILAKGDY